MAIFHVATNTPPKAEIIAQWIKTQPWGPSADASVELLGSYHLDDPAGRVGMQGFMVEAAGQLLHIPLTYRDTRVPHLEDAFIATMEHSVLGTRYLYDGLRDERFMGVLAGVAATGYGQALGFAEHEGSWYAVPDDVLLQGSGTIGLRIAVGDLVAQSSNEESTTFANDGLELTFFRRPTTRSLTGAGLTATWQGQPTPVTLAEVRLR